MTGPLGLDRPLVLSPMVDVTDAAFRSVAREWGAEITCSEMVAAAGIIHGNEKSWRLTEPWPGETPYGIQLMGSSAEEIGTAVADVVAQRKVDFIDINLGCPSPNILRSCAGGFLLRDPPLVGRVVAAAVDAAGDVPVSVKLRKGHDEEHQTYIEVAQEAEANGAAWCTLHGRTVVQGYSGDADWDAIGRLVEAVEIPVVGNGDLRTPEDVVRMADETHCAGFFIARAAMHDPTVFRSMRAALDGHEPVPATLAERLSALRLYLERTETLGGMPLALLKRQATRFVQGTPGARALRNAMHTAPDAATVLECVSSLEVAGLDDGE